MKKGLEGRGASAHLQRGTGDFFRQGREWPEAKRGLGTVEAAKALKIEPMARVCERTSALSSRVVAVTWFPKTNQPGCFLSPAAVVFLFVCFFFCFIFVCFFAAAGVEAHHIHCSGSASDKRQWSLSVNKGGLVEHSELWVLGKREILAVGTRREDYEFQQITRKHVAKSLASLYVFPSVCSSPLSHSLIPSHSLLLSPI